MRIIPRSEWGARPARNRTTIARNRRRTFVVHYEGPATSRTGHAIPQSIQRYHMDSNGWSDIGYNFVISQAGEIFEGRGWDALGAHAGATGNVEGIGVQVHIGGDQQPTPTALHALTWLKGEADRVMGRTLAWSKHNDYMSTSCPGKPLERWLATGRPISGAGPSYVPGWDGRPIKGGTVTTAYGRRGPYWSTDKDRNGHGVHVGDDWNLPGGTPVGTPVYAVADGTVTIADGGALGLMSILKADNGRFYRYCHLRKGSRDPWNGERVRAGQKIAEVGDTGNITAPHLHLEDTATAQIWPPVGHRKPSWPVPQPTIHTPAPEEDLMPELHAPRTTFQYPGGGYSLIFPVGKTWPDAVATVPVAARYAASAQLHAPGGVQLRTRYVWFGDDWVRGMETPHATNFANTAQTGECGNALYLDIWASRPCEITVEQQATYWPLKG